MRKIFKKIEKRILVQIIPENGKDLLILKLKGFHKEEVPITEILETKPEIKEYAKIK